MGAGRTQCRAMWQRNMLHCRAVSLGNCQVPHRLSLRHTDDGGRTNAFVCPPRSILHLMALPAASLHRTLKHRRTIDVQAFSRGDGLWEVDAHICDIKTSDVKLAGGVRPAGQPIHDMLLRVVIDEQFNILESGAQTDWMPYTGLCDQHGDAYAQLVGLNLLKGFYSNVKARLGGVRGCTHLTELTQVLPTAVVQAFAGEVRDIREGASEDTPPFQINRCHALKDDAPAVQRFYPRWYKSVTDPSH
jgi:Protein of unknown function (DUF2889)